MPAPAHFANHGYFENSLLAPTVALFWEGKTPGGIQRPVQPDPDSRPPSPRADPWGVARRLVLTVAIVLLGYYFFFASPDTSSPPDARCENSEVQILARKLFVITFDDMSRPQTGIKRWMSSHDDPKIKTMRNTRKATYTDPGSVRFDSVKTIMAPSGDTTKSASESKIQYACSAIARFQLPPGFAARLDDNGAISTILERHGNEIGIAIIYTTEINSEGELEIGLRYAHPLMNMILNSLFRTDPEETPKAPGSAGSPGTTNSQ